jgi:hypothetical protein
MKRVGTAALLGAGLCVVLTGCVVFRGPVKVKQIGDKPKVQVRFTICNSDDDPDPGYRCPDLGNSDDAGNETGVTFSERVLLAFRVPKGTKVPRTIRPVGGNAEGRFVPDRAYGAVLDDEAPTGRRYAWKGYVSTPVYDPGSPNDPYRFDLGRFKVKMKVPARIVGKTFKVRPVVGWLVPEEGDIVCGAALYDRAIDGNGERICIDSPSPSTVRKSVKVKIERR